MKTLTINVPGSLDIDSKQVSLLVATRCMNTGNYLLGQAVELARMSKRTFAEILGIYEVSVFNYPAADLAHDVKNA